MINFFLFSFFLMVVIFLDLYVLSSNDRKKLSWIAPIIVLLIEIWLIMFVVYIDQIYDVLCLKFLFLFDIILNYRVFFVLKFIILYVYHSSLLVKSVFYLILLVLIFFVGSKTKNRRIDNFCFLACIVLLYLSIICFILWMLS